MDNTQHSQPVTAKTLRSAVTPQVWAEITSLAKPSSFRGLALYVGVYAAIGTAIAASLYLNHLLATILAVVFIGGRQHSLYILNHDAAHYGLFKTPFANKFLGTLLSNFVMFHHPSAWSYVQWRRVHRFHHTDLFTDRDPNYVDRVNAGDTLTHISLSGLFWRSIKDGILSPVRVFIAKQDYVPPNGDRCYNGKYNHLRALLIPFQGDREMEVERLLKLGFFIIAFSLISYYGVWSTFLIYWVLPMYLVYPMILAFMDYTEHRWPESGDDLEANSRSVRLGFLSKVIISFLPRGLHREHHLYQNVIAYKLPELSTILSRETRFTLPLNGLPALLNDVAMRARA